jgi:hypothetical protein
MLDNLIKKYGNKDGKPNPKDIHELVYKLSYAGKFIIIKANTLGGSLKTISDTFEQFSRMNPRFDKHLYRNLYSHYIKHPGMRFRIKVLAKVGPKTTQYQVLKREQMELDKAKYDPQNLNNTDHAYIPEYKPATDTFGWLTKATVAKFKAWEMSKARAAYIKRYRAK